jgi:hypothetical protein
MIQLGGLKQHLSPNKWSNQPYTLRQQAGREKIDGSTRIADRIHSDV